MQTRAFDRRPPRAPGAPRGPLPALALALALAGTLAVGACRPALEAPADPGPWPQWRGPGAHAVSADTGLPDTWGPDAANVVWAAEIPGRGNSQPVVSGGRVFLTTAREAEPGRVERSALAVDFASGELLWQTEIFAGPGEEKHPFNTWATPTPATDGARVFVYFGSVLAALDFEGELLWAREVDPAYVDHSHYGIATSPMLTADAVVVARDREEVADDQVGWLAAYAKETGDELWRNEWDHTCCSYTSPIPLERPSGLEILFSHAGYVAGYAPASGELLWRQGLRQNQPVQSPVAAGDLLAVFGGADRVRNGAVLRLAGSGAATEVEVLWQTRRMIPQVSSPVVYDGLLYVVVDNGVLICYDPETGRQVYRARLPGAGYRPSPVAGDGKIYAVNDLGLTAVVAAGPTFRLIAANELGEGSGASPAIADGSLLIRTASKLWRIGSGTAG